MKFSSLGVPDYVLRALETKNITECTPIQKETIPLLIQGKDVIGKSKTGSGKTFAYAIPAVATVSDQSEKTQVLVVCPTRELAAQVVNEIRFLNSYREGCKVVPVFGGINMARQVTALKRNAEIVVGTPGRLVDHLKRRTLKTEELKMLVLDEADEMLKMGFKEEIEKIVSKCPGDRVTAMFSATMPPEAKRIAENYMRSPVTVGTDDEVTRSVTQFFVRTGLKDKDATLKKLISRFAPSHAMVFCNTKRMVEKLAVSLSAVGVKASAIHGDMPQKERKVALEKLKSGEVSLMIATDVAARGIDVEGVDVVFNYDVPQSAEYYVHRIGRTGRVDKTGVSYTLVNTDWGMKCLAEIIAATGNRVSEYEINDKAEKAEGKKATAKKRKEAEKYEKEHLKPEYINKGERLGAERDYIDGVRGKQNYGAKEAKSRRGGNEKGFKKTAARSKNENKKTDIKNPKTKNETKNGYKKAEKDGRGAKSVRPTDKLREKNATGGKNNGKRSKNLSR